MPDPSAFAASESIAARRLLPLQGLTILAVEDSRFASEALRLLCQRSGARLRRAETLEAAARHLSLYRPDVVIVDLGLPDGDGADLIRTLSRDATCPVVLATSGDPAGERLGRAAGATAFLPKPPDSVAAFQQAILRHLPGSLAQDEANPGQPLHPDTLALRDDLVRAAALLAATRGAAQRRYVAGFLGSLAQSAHDALLARAADEAAEHEAGLPRLAALVRERLASVPGPFR